MKILTRIAAASALCLAIFASSCRKDTIVNNITQIDTVFIGHPKSDTSADGYILLSPFSSPKDAGSLQILDGAGNVLKQKAMSGGAMNFRRWVVNGQVRYTWSVYDPSAYVIPVINNYCFYNVIADSNLNEIKRVSLFSKGDISTAKNQGTDLHDFIYLSDNHYLTLSYYQKTVTNVPSNLAPGDSAQVVCPVIQEIENDQVTWQWEGSDYPEFYSTSIESNDFATFTTPQDYMHMNSMFVDPTDNNLIVSCRNLNQVFKINRTTGAIMWRLGGLNSDFPLATDQQFLRQHCATLVDNNQTLLLFDNGEINLRPNSRVLEFQLNQTAKTVTGFRSFNIPEPFSQIMGSVQKFGTHYFIGGGSGRYFLNVNYLTGEKYQEVMLPAMTYRTFRYLQ